jgi:glycogenin glucosyltransferase
MMFKNYAKGASIKLLLLFCVAGLCAVHILTHVIGGSRMLLKQEGKPLPQTRPTVSYKRVLVVTMVTDDPALYAQGSVKLIASIKQTLLLKDTHVEFSLIQLAHKTLNENTKEILESAGWNIITLSRIAPRDEDGTFSRFRDQFSKLHVWNMTTYDRVVYMDSDAFCIGNISSMLSMDISSRPIWAARDIRAAQWQESFNMGVFMIKPNASEFKFLLKQKDDPSIEFETAMAEQGFLNVVYRDNWGDIGFTNNANLAAYVQDRQLWDRVSDQINVIHFTMQKPWDCGGEYREICQKWVDAQFQAFDGPNM